MRLVKIINLWLPPVIWALIIFSFSSITTPKVSPVYWQDFIVKKTAHIIEYGILAVLLYRALKASGLSKRQAGIWAIIIVFFYGVTDEFHQSFTPMREPRVRDVLIDTLGASLFVLALWRLLPKAPEKVKLLAQRLGLV